MAFLNVSKKQTTPSIVWTPEMTINVADEIPLIPVERFQTGWGADSVNRVAVIRRIYIMYTAATDTANTSNILIGTLSTNTKFHSISTPSGKAIGDVDVVEQADLNGTEDRFFTSDSWVQVETSGGSGTGTFFLGIEFTNDITKSEQFSRTL